MRVRTAHRFTLAEFDTLARQGVVDERAELILGTMFDPMTESPQHANFVALLGRLLAAQLPPEFVRTQQVVIIGDSAPRPDVSILRTENRLDEHLSPQHLQCVIEVAVSSQNVDLGVKADLYRGSVGSYVVVLLEEQTSVVPSGFDEPPAVVTSSVESALARFV